MTGWIAAGSVLCVLAALAVWQIGAARELLQKRDALTLAINQLTLYRLLHSRARDGPELRRTREQLELSQAICRDVTAEYNRCVARPKNRLMARILNCNPVSEEKEP